MEKPLDPKAHWENVYKTKAFEEVSWYQAVPQDALDWILALDLPKDAAIMDLGSGESMLSDCLLQAGFQKLHVLDISASALDRLKKRHGKASEMVRYFCADAAHLPALPAMDLWHDRAVFHFLTDEKSRENYLKALKTNLKPRGFLLLATFAEDGPEACSGLPVCRYSPPALNDLLGRDFELLRQKHVNHYTPTGKLQRFTYVLFTYQPQP